MDKIKERYKLINWIIILNVIALIGSIALAFYDKATAFIPIALAVNAVLVIVARDHMKNKVSNES